ncbi:MAG TPA: aminoglycoside adenylyltransferase domain-containing protein [Acidimicrobiales bacterium]|nr:aminoglycoside adenylyltransferase domain-containing protein [Acidimicrobiales bacterium]
MTPGCSAATEAGWAYLADADRMLPGRIDAFYLVGSSALGAFRCGRSDVDFVAVVDRDLKTVELRRLRFLHGKSAARTAWRALGNGHSPLSGTCNGVFVRRADVSLPVTEIRPVASQTGELFTVGTGFDVNPVAWKVLLDHGIALRGPSPSELGLDAQSHLLRAWNIENLGSYWHRWAVGLLQRPTMTFWMRPRWSSAWGVLGAPRLHHTIATGAVVSKEAAGEYALESFDRRWRPIIHTALAWWRQESAIAQPRDVRERARQTAGFVLDVIRCAQAL